MMQERRLVGEWHYLYCAVDKKGATINFPLCAKHDTAAATRFFNTARLQNDEPGTVTMDKSGANKAAMDVINVDRAVAVSSPGSHALENSALIFH